MFDVDLKAFNKAIDNMVDGLDGNIIQAIHNTCLIGATHVIDNGPEMTGNLKKNIEEHNISSEQPVIHQDGLYEGCYRTVELTNYNGDFKYASYPEYDLYEPPKHAHKPGFMKDSAVVAANSLKNEAEAAVIETIKNAK